MMSGTNGIMIKVFSSPTCARCGSLMVKFRAADILFEKVLIDEEIAQTLRDLGFSSLPVVQVGSEYFTGPEALDYLITET